MKKLMLLMALLLPMLASAQEPYAGMDDETLPPPYNFTLMNQEGEMVSSADWRGKLVLLFFSYTHCEDKCPAGLAQLTAVLNLLGDKAQQVVPVFVSLDVERDTPATLKEYMENFYPGFIALTGTQQEIDKVTHAYGVIARRTKTDQGLMFDYTADTMLLDEKGEVVQYFPYSVKPIEMVESLQDWLK